MRTVRQRLTSSPVANERLVLPYELRQRSRLRARLESGEEVGLFLERGHVLRGGDLLLADDGAVIEVIAALETVSSVSESDAMRLARASYHLGNRHVPVQLGAGWLRYGHDHVLDDMVRGLGLNVVVEQAPFEPESGAYGHSHGAGEHSHASAGETSHSHAMGHSHEHAHDHAHAADEGHSHEQVHAYAHAAGHARVPFAAALAIPHGAEMIEPVALPPVMNRTALDVAPVAEQPELESAETAQPVAAFADAGDGDHDGESSIEVTQEHLQIIEEESLAVALDTNGFEFQSVAAEVAAEVVAGVPAATEPAIRAPAAVTPETVSTPSLSVVKTEPPAAHAAAPAHIVADDPVSAEADTIVAPILVVPVEQEHSIEFTPDLTGEHTFEFAPEQRPRAQNDSDESPSDESEAPPGKHAAK